MAAMQGAISAAERSLRSVFVGNIPYEATEEQLKDIFAEIGPVVSFRLVYDRETGKPKGYGFCEYKDQEMALSAMRNLNGYELNGRALRVDNAASEKSKEELKNLQASLGGPPVESPYGPEIDPDKAPVEISKAVASLPPEQMFELMKQMKLCVQNNPNEARNLLLQNPQLAYALLQAQVVMRIVEPNVAMTMLHRPNTVAKTDDDKAQMQQTMTSAPPQFPVHQSLIKPDMGPQIPMISTGMHQPPPNMNMPVNPLMTNLRPPNMPPSGPQLMGDPSQMPSQNNPPHHNMDMDNFVDPRLMGDHDLRMQQSRDRDMRLPPPVAPMMDKDMRQNAADQDMRRSMNHPQAPPQTRPYDPRSFRGMPPTGGPPPAPFGQQRPSGAPFDPRSGGFDARAADPRNGQLPQRPNMGMGGSPAVQQVSPLAPQSSPRQQSSLAAAAAAIAPHDQEKAQLIMQVLQLTDDQIQQLPTEQRQSIMILKEQISRQR